MNELCQTARKLMDCRGRLSSEEGSLLKEHLESCPACALEARFEERLREVIVPRAISTPSPGFEASLRMRLGIGLAPRPDPITRWGWVAAVLTLSVLVLPYITRISGVLGRLVTGMATGLAGLFGRADSAARPLFGQLEQLSNPEHALILNLVMGAIVLLGGIIAVEVSERS